ncbi:MAG: hemolysin III family protein [Verrucomicrobiota bacterium]
MSKNDKPQPGFLSTELANSITHGVACLLSIAGLVVLIVLAAKQGGARHVVACSIYGATLVFLYLASTLYHSVTKPKVKRFFQIIDHSAIYLLIAGSYTPFMLISVRGGWGWSVFGVVWTLALLGIVYKSLFMGRFKIFSVTLYLFMGWMSLMVLKPLLAVLPVGGVIWLAVGGVFYTVGVVFFVWESFPHHHAIWHLFVMAGSACHFFSVMFYVLPTN